MEHSQIDRPVEVGRGILFLNIALGLGVLRFIMEASRQSQHPSIVFASVVSVTVLFIIWFFIQMIGKGKNWARITFLVFFIIGLPFEVQALQQSLAANPVSCLLGIAQTLIQIIAWVYMLQKQSSDWFRKMQTNLEEPNKAQENSA